MMVWLVYKSYRNGISPMPSNIHMRLAVATEIKRLPSPASIVDAGAGFGGLVRHLASVNSQHHYTGIENSFVPLCFAKLTLLFQPKHNRKADFIYCSMLDYNYSDTDVVVSYLYPGGTQRLYEIVKQHNKHMLFISIAFAVNHVTPIRTYTCPDLYKTKVYVYHIQPILPIKEE